VEPQGPDGRDDASDVRRPVEPSPRVRVRHLRDASDPDPDERSAPVGPRPSTPAGLREVTPRESRWDTVAGTDMVTDAEQASTDATFADHGSLPIVGGSSDEDLTVDGTAEVAEAGAVEGAALEAAEVEAPEVRATGDRTDVGLADRAPSTGDAAEADRAAGSDDAVAAGDTSADDVAEADADDPTPEAGVETDPPEKLDSARLAALSMAAEGRSREEVEAVLRDDLKIIDHASLIDYVFGISTPSSIVPSWPPRRRRRS